MLIDCEGDQYVELQIETNVGHYRVENESVGLLKINKRLWNMKDDAEKCPKSDVSNTIECLFVAHV